MSESKKLFNSYATFVRFVDKKIFAIGKRQSLLHILDPDLTILEVVDYQFEEEITVLQSSSSHVAIGEKDGQVTIFDKDGNFVMVSYFRP